MRIFLSILTLTLALMGCKKKNQECDIFQPIIFLNPQTASYPQWDPSGNFIVFNYEPYSKRSLPPCGPYNFSMIGDSIGIYMIKKDGTGLTRITDYLMRGLQWSPDGKWLAGIRHEQIFLIPYDGAAFDTSARVQLTPGKDYNYQYMRWSPDGDSLYCLRQPANIAVKEMFRIAPDGTGGTVATNTLEFFWITQDRIYFNQGQDIFSVNRDGSDKRRHTSDATPKMSPSVYNDLLFYESSNSGLWAGQPGGSFKELVNFVRNYDISSGGEIVYSRFNTIIEPDFTQNGTLWIMNTDGSNKRQLTSNPVD